MPPALLESIHYWADVQSLLTRVTEQEVIWKYPIAKKMLSATVALYRWYCQRNSAAKWLGLVATHNGKNLVAICALHFLRLLFPYRPFTQVIKYAGSRRGRYLRSHRSGS